MWERALPAKNDDAILRCLLRYFGVIHHPVHRQFRLHDDLLDSQRRMPMRALQVRREISSHDAGRGQ